MKRLLFLTILYCFFPFAAKAATEFVNVVDPGNGSGTDYTSLSVWENSFGTIDLTSANTKVFSGTTTGTLSDSVTVYQCRSGAYQSVTGTMTHDTASQALVKSIITAAASFSANDRWYTNNTCNSANYFTISNTGDSAIAVAKCRTTTGTRDNSGPFIISGWTTSNTNYVKIWTDPAENYRHAGVWDETKYILSSTAGYGRIVDINIDYVKMDGLQIKQPYDNIALYPSMSFELSNTIIDNTAGGNPLFVTGTNVKIWNVIAYGNGSGPAILSTVASGYFYNNTFANFGVGYEKSCSSNDYIKNTIFYNITTDYQNDGCGSTPSFTYSATNNAGSNMPAGTGNRYGATFSFLNSSSNNFHLTSSDAGAKDLGTDLSSDTNLAFSTDIDREGRTGVWDIGADEVMTAVVNSSQTGKSTSGLVGMWSFDGQDIDWGAGSGQIKDRSGQIPANDGTVSGLTQSSVTPGRIGQALSFDGSNYVSLFNDPIDVGTATVCAWVYPTAPSSQAILTNSRFLLGIYPSNDRVQLHSSSSGVGLLSQVNSITLNTWQYICGIRNSGTDGAGSIYINGVLNVSGNTDTPVSGYGLNIGNNQYNEFPFNGKIDEVRIYNRALTETEIGDLYRMGQEKINVSQSDKSTNGLVLMQDFNGPHMDWSDTDAEAKDQTTNHNDGDVVGATVAPGKIGQALSFDGSNYVSLFNDPIDVGTATVCAWVYPTAPSSQAILTNSRFLLGIYPSNDRVQLHSSSSGVGLLSQVNSITLNTWQYICGIRNSGTDGPGSIYINGVLNVSGNTDTPVSGYGLNIGNNQYNEFPFNGKIDEVRIYNRALTETEIGDLYRMGQAKIIR